VPAAGSKPAATGVLHSPPALASRCFPGAGPRQQDPASAPRSRHRCHEADGDRSSPAAFRAGPRSPQQAPVGGQPCPATAAGRWKDHEGLGRPPIKASRSRFQHGHRHVRPPALPKPQIPRAAAHQLQTLRPRLESSGGSWESGSQIGDRPDCNGPSGDDATRGGAFRGDHAGRPGFSPSQNLLWFCCRRQAWRGQCFRIGWLQCPSRGRQVGVTQACSGVQRHRT